MRRIRLAYRDDDRTPVIFCIREMARRYYDIEVEVIQIKATEDYEAALFNGACDVIIEHLEYLYDEAANGRKVALFLAPSRGGNLELVVSAHVERAEDLKGRTMAVRTQGQPHAVALWLKMMGLEKEVRTVDVPDKEVGRWAQWKKVVSGECAAAFVSALYLPQALGAGLKVLDVPEIPIVGHYAQACLSAFAAANSALVGDYVKASIHAVCLMLYRRDEALEIAAQEPMRRLKIDSRKELERQFDAIVKSLKSKPYPTPQAIANTFEIAVLDYPAAQDINPLSLWDLHWVRQLDDAGFIDGLIGNLAKPHRSA
jgi:ABC-type nitrate/sulfonate/bicarbonate transport system substrate-binding protein